MSASLSGCSDHTVLLTTGIFAPAALVEYPDFGEDVSAVPKALSILTKAGLQVVSYPCFRKSILKSAPLLQDLALKRAPWSWVVFLSQNGVKGFWANLCYYHQHFVSKKLSFLEFLARYLDKVQIAAIGQATGEAVKGYLGCEPALVASIADSETLASHLLEVVSRGAFVALCQGVQGRPLLANVLQAAGLLVSRFAVYDTAPITELSLLKELSRKYLSPFPGIAYALLTSPVAVEGFKCLQELEPRRFNATFYLSMGQTTTRAMESYGLPVASESRKHNLEDLASSLITLREQTSCILDRDV